MKNDGSTVLSRVRVPSGASSTRLVTVPHQISAMPTPERLAGACGVGTHRVPAARLVRVADEAVRQRVVEQDEAVQVAQLAFEPTGGEGAMGEAAPASVPGRPHRDSTLPAVPSHDDLSS
ncbi:hypothetical protein ABZW30_34250 [Kitasatospora sp. NPDC004669]|uniref:hypothetical protein n=1 Tax=Kitasatospora sp. NPDC004669 TaxID=3154555 RepID=UPI0033AC0502